MSEKKCVCTDCKCKKMIDRKKVIVISKEGKQISLDDWQKQYDLPVGSTKIGKYFDLTEARFANDLSLYGQIVVNSQLMRVLDQFREDVQRPITINSFNRSQEKQNELSKEGFRAASYSPHVVRKDQTHGITGGFAADIDTSSNEQTDKEVIILSQAAKKLGIKIRIGWNEYKQNKQTFIHVDVGCEYYAPGKPWNKIFHPLAWEKEARW
jgi:hypothetical protein